MTTSDVNGLAISSTENSGGAGSRNHFPLRGYANNSEEEGPWARKTVLSFDGGGIRGYSSLLILKRIMTRIRELETQSPESPVSTSCSYPWMGSPSHEHAAAADLPDRVDDFLPCHYFDYVAGTSTGGLSAIMLGRLRMTVDQALDQYVKFGNAVFGKPRWFHERSALWYPRAKFSSRKTRAAFQKTILASLRRDRPETPAGEANHEHFKYREDRTRTMAVSWYIKKEAGTSGPHVWRSYDNTFNTEARDSNRWNPTNPGTANTAEIWEVARATTAAPRFFESIKIGDRKHLDGGMAANNPALMALQEIHGLHNIVPALFVSIGTGLRPAGEDGRKVQSERDIHRELRRAETSDNVRRKQFLKKYLEIGRHFKNNMVDCEGQNGTNGWRSHCEAIGLENRYRLNVRGDLFKVPLAYWRPANSGKTTLAAITQETNAYLDDPRVVEDIDSIAREAVRIRRKRAATERWEPFAVDVDYGCRICQSSKRYQTRLGLRHHLEESVVHRNTDGGPTAPERVEAELNAGRSRKGRVANEAA